MKSQSRWNKIYQKQQKRQKERELQAMLGKQQREYYANCEGGRRMTLMEQTAKGKWQA